MKTKNYYRDFFTKVFKNASFIIPLIIISIIFSVGLVMCHFVNKDLFLQVNLDKAYLLPSWKYPFGTNEFGQNQFYIVFIGAYKTLLLAIVATFLNLIIGIIVGILWGTYKTMNSIMFVFKNLIDNTPIVFFYVLIVLFFKDGFWPFLLLVILIGWIEFAYLIRNNLIIIKSKDYNKVSYLYKVSLFKIALNNYLPSILPLLFNSVALCIPQVISLEITLAYFQFPLGDNNSSLGMLLYSSIANNDCYTYYYLFLIPLTFLFIINLCIYIISKTISSSFSKEGV